jgi:hypothetical protein
LATYNSSSITRGDPGRLGIYGTTAIGEINLGNVTLTANDVLPLVPIPYGCFLKTFIINLPILNPSGTTLAMSLLDTLASPTTYISASTSGTNFSAATTLSTTLIPSTVMGTMYGATARSIGATGCPVVVWTAGVILQLKVTATATAAVGSSGANISYMIEWGPSYDAGT